MQTTGKNWVVTGRVGELRKRPKRWNKNALGGLYLYSSPFYYFTFWLVGRIKVRDQCALIKPTGRTYPGRGLPLYGWTMSCLRGYCTDKKRKNTDATV